MSGTEGELFELWRQDDNCNCFLVESHAERLAAEKRLGELEKKGHKQLYWISPRRQTPKNT